MSETITLKQVVTHPFFAMISFLSVCHFLPRYGGVIATIVGSASVLSVLVAVLPEQFRRRSGSLTAANSLVAALWIAAAGITALTLVSEIRG